MSFNLNINEYELGNVIRITGTFTDIVDAPVDPNEVYFDFIHPVTKTVTTYKYGVDPEVQKDGVGIYHVDLEITAVGHWLYRFYSKLSGIASDENQFKVPQSKFD